MDIQVNWNLKDIFKSEKEFEEEIKEVKKEIKLLSEFKGKLYNNAKKILEFKNISNELSKKLEKISGYSYLKYSQNMTNNINIVRYKKVEQLGELISNTIYFVIPELSKMGKDDFDRIMKEEPELKEYKLEFDDILENKKHVLEESQEKILANFSSSFDGYSNIYKILTNTEFKFNTIKDSKGKKYPLNESVYTLYMTSSDEVLRRNAFTEMYKVYSEHINTISEIFLRDLKTESVSIKNRKYKSSLEAAVKFDESTIKVYDTLVKSVNDNLKLNHEYISFKKDILKKYLNDKDFHIYDVYVNVYEKILENNKKKEKEISIEKSREIVLKALKPLGDEYLKLVSRAYVEGWLDVYPNESKRKGAFSLGIYGVHPYVMLNYVGKFNDVSTIVHELGHAMHSYYADKTQEIYNADYTILVAEVASTVNEILLANYLIENETDQMKKKMLLVEHIDTIRATLIRQTMFAEFEKIIHEKSELDEILTSNDLNEIYFDLVKNYFGKDIILDQQIKYEWARIPHFYTSYYVYKYATGISSAIFIVNNILTKGEEYRDKYIKMLKTGGKYKSLKVLKIADVDLEDEELYNNAYLYLEEKINELKELEKNSK